MNDPKVIKRVEKMKSMSKVKKTIIEYAILTGVLQQW